MNVTTKPEPLAVVERARSLLLKAGHPPVAELEARKLDLERVIAAGERDIEELDAQRKSALVSEASAGEVAKTRAAIRGRSDEITDLIEIAAAVHAKLDERIAAQREAALLASRQAAYDEALKLHVEATNRVREFLGRFGPEARKVMREYAESELKTASANSDPPAGALPIPSIEAERRGELRAPKTTVREFKAFVDGRRFVAEQNYVQAAERKDGKWDVWEQGGTTGGGYYCVCELVAYVEAVTENDVMPWHDFLATSLSVPSFSVTQIPGWRPIPADNLGPPDQIVSELEKLESSPPFRFEPRVERRLMTTAQWRRLNGETLEADPPRTQMAAE